MEYARITAKHFGVRLHEYYVTPEDVVCALPLIATSYDEPFGNSSALPAYFCAKMAASDGVKLLLGGDGGDEIFAGNGRYAQQRVFERYQTVPSWIRAGLLEPLIGHTASWVPLADKSRSYIAQANTPLPDRLQTYNFLHQYPAGDIFQPEFLRNLMPDFPLELQREIYGAPQDASKLNRMLYLDWQFTLADNDLREVSSPTLVSKCGHKIAK
ncbi:MAG: asparagine synthase (glutamine-hydrolyzing) [Halioglobus sp.]|jgi:asparagine synthase (glutamine-hydrolysing)